MISVSDGLLDIVIFATLRLKQQTLPLLDCRKLDFYLKAKFSTFEKLLITYFSFRVSPGNTDAAGSDTPCSTDYIEVWTLVQC